MGKLDKQQRVCRKLCIIMFTIEGQSQDVVVEERLKGGIFDGGKSLVIAEWI